MAGIAKFGTLIKHQKKTMKNKIRIVIADDHQIFIEGIKALIKDSDKVILVGESRDGETLIQILKTKEPDVVLMDVNMPKLNGIEATKKIKELFPNMKILGLTMYDDANSISEMMKAGASGYLLKTTGKSELLNAISKVQQGEKYFSNEVSMKLIERMFDDNGRDDVKTLPRKAEITRRELDIIRLIAEEMTNIEIAKKLNNSPMTIITHRKNLLRKLGVKNTAGLVKYAVMNGLLES
jgi:DNA-binding NarL/FixJ family response regulator